MYLNDYYPLWLVLIVSPLILVMITSSFIMSFIGIMSTIVILKIKDIFNFYSKNIFKLWFISLFLNILTAVFFFIPQFFKENNYIKVNLIEPLLYNPYSKGLSFIYTVLVLSICFFISYKLIKIFVIKKMNIEKSKTRLVTIIISTFIMPYLMFVPSNFIIKQDKSKLEDYQGTSIQNTNDVLLIMKNLEVSKYISSHVLESKKEPYTIHIYLRTIENGYAIMFEKDSIMLFNLIDNVSEIVYHMNNKKYNYNIGRINKILDDVKSIKFVNIYDRYENIWFYEYKYLGHVDEYDIFDTSDKCIEGKHLIYSNNYEKYYMKCTNLNFIMLLDKKGKSINLKDALESKKIFISDFLANDIEILVEKNEDNSK